MSKNTDLSETCFSQVNDVGLSIYVVYVINKMVLMYFIKSWIVLLWKWVLFGKVTLWDERHDLWDFLVVGRWNTHVCTPTLICD